MNRIGIDFGTTKTMVSRYNPSSGLVEVLKLGREGNSAIPTAIHLDSSGAFSFGDDAEDMFATDPEGYCRAFKLELGEDANPALSRVLSNGCTKCFTAENLTGFFLEYIRKRIMGEVASLNNLSSCTITVPVTGGEGTAWRAALKRAAIFAGFTDVDFLAEPIAAGRAYLRDEQVQNFSRAMIVDWGGGTLDISVVSRSADGCIKADVRSAKGRDDIGGEEIDILLVRYLLKMWREKFGMEAFETADIIKMLKCRRVAKNTKEQLSFRETYPVRLVPPKNISVSQTNFNALIESFIGNAIDLAKKVLGSDKLKHELLDVILMVGGTCQIPFLKTSFEQAFPHIKVQTWMRASEAVALGALDMPEWTAGMNHPEHPEDKNVLSLSMRGKWGTAPGYSLVWRRDGSPKAKWSVGVTDERKKGMLSSCKEGEWDLLPGYCWHVQGISTIWKSGQFHPTVNHCRTSMREGVWETDCGYELTDPLNPLRGIRWSPGTRIASCPHVSADEKEGVWIADDGYLLYKKEINTDQGNTTAIIHSFLGLVASLISGGTISTTDPFLVVAKWMPGQRNRSHKHFIATEKEGKFAVERGWKKVHPDPNDWRVRRDSTLRLKEDVVNAFGLIDCPWLFVSGGKKNITDEELTNARKVMGISVGTPILAIWDNFVVFGIGMKGFVIVEKGIYIRASSLFSDVYFIEWQKISEISVSPGEMRVNGIAFELDCINDSSCGELQRAFYKLINV